MQRPRDTNGWTGGQWSLARAALALGLGGWILDTWLGSSRKPLVEAFLGFPLVAFVVLATAHVAAGASRDVAGLLFLGLALVRFLQVEFQTFGHGHAVFGDVVAPHGALVLVVLMLVYLAIARGPDPFGSWPARRRPDPGAGWRLPDGWLRLTCLCFLTYAASAGALLYAEFHHRRPLLRGLGSYDPVYTGLLSALISPWWFARRARPWVWLAGLGLVVGPSVVAGWPLVLGFGLVLALLAFDPGWIRPSRAGTTDVLFFDGACGLCHATVRFVLAEDRTASAFSFAPIGGAAWCEVFPAPHAAPRETLVVRTAAGETLVRSRAVLHVGRRLGGLWRALGTLGLVVPRPLGDLAYRALARVRRRLFAAPSGACPVVSPDLVRRFDLRPAPPPP